MLSAPYAFAAAPSNLDLATTLGSLVLVIGVILLLAWLLKRMQVPALGQQKRFTHREPITCRHQRANRRGSGWRRAVFGGHHQSIDPNLSQARKAIERGRVGDQCFCQSVQPTDQEK